MCGILGAITFSGRELTVDDAAVMRSLDSIAHRGPDDSGVWWNEDRTAVLGHRRLSILDLSSAGHQPMSYADGQLWITYNGEIYNFQHIRSDLESKGYTFGSQTDTEVILAGYREYGPDIVKKLRGMFSFAIWDVRTKRLFIARDRLGIKPLYYTWSSGTFYFASEIKALLALPSIPKDIDRESLYQYLTFGKTYSPRTMFTGIWKFPAGHCATVSAADRIEPQEYWTPYDEKVEFPEDAGEEYFSEQVRVRLEEAVRLRMLSDVPVGVFLSGGVDSTANVAFMSRVAGGRVHTFTAGFQGQDAYDERIYARQASKLFGTDHNEVEITPRDMTELLPQLAWYLDEPVCDPTVVPIHFVSKLARSNGAIVILNGDGSDELFCGYRKYMKFLKLKPYWNLINKFPTVMRRGFASAGNAFGGNGIVKDLLERSSRGVEFYIGNSGPLKQVSEFRNLLNGQAGSVYEPVIRGRKKFQELHAGNDYAEWLSYWGIRSEVEEVFLYRADRIGMASSIEIRVPFLDHKLVEFGMQMPQQWKYRNGEPKYILKKALEGIIPNELIYRKKQGFNVPIREWAGKEMNETILTVLPKLHSDRNLLGKEMVDNICSYISRNQTASGDLIWSLYSLAMWYERWGA